MSMPHSVVLHADPQASESFARDVRYYLALTPRQLPSRYLYDALGSALFEAICALPWYPITRVERRLLALHGQDILAHVPGLATVAELGPGNGHKIATLLGTPHGHGDLVVHLIDVSVAALDTARRALSVQSGLEIVTHPATYEMGLEEVRRARNGRGRTLVLLLGSNIGNFDPPGAHTFLEKIRASLVEGDALLIGVDLVKSEDRLLLAYDDPLGITAAFNRNLLVRMNRELCADFDIAGFQHRAVWTARESRIEMHLVSARRQRVRVPAASLEVVFAEGETIWTESSYKYHPHEISEVLERAGFGEMRQWLDEEDGFALTLAEAI
jgi:L-histidine Nalpha-methyltransferase